MDIEIIKAFAPYVATVAGIVTFYIGRKFDIKSREKKEVQRDDEQDKRFDSLERQINNNNEMTAKLSLSVQNVEITNSRIENDVRELAALHKYENFHKKLNSEIRSTVIQLLSTQKVQNSEIKQMFITSVSRFKNVIADILQADFEGITAESIIELLTIESKHVYTQLNIKLFELNNPAIFLDEIKSKVIEPKFRIFAVELVSIAQNYENGKRRELFRSMVLALVSNIVNETLVIYDSQKKHL